MMRAGEWAELEEAFEAAVGDCLPAVARKFKLDEQQVLGLWGELMAALAPAVYAGPPVRGGDEPAGCHQHHGAAV